MVWSTAHIFAIRIYLYIKLTHITGSVCSVCISKNIVNVSACVFVYDLIQETAKDIHTSQLVDYCYIDILKIVINNGLCTAISECVCTSVYFNLMCLGMK